MCVRVRVRMCAEELSAGQLDDLQIGSAAPSILFFSLQSAELLPPGAYALLVTLVPDAGSQQTPEDLLPICTLAPSFVSEVGHLRHAAIANKISLDEESSARRCLFTKGLWTTMGARGRGKGEEKMAPLYHSWRVLFVLASRRAFPLL